MPALHCLVFKFLISLSQDYFTAPSLFSICLCCQITADFWWWKLPISNKGFDLMPVKIHLICSKKSDIPGSMFSSKSINIIPNYSGGWLKINLIASFYSHQPHFWMYLQITHGKNKLMEVRGMQYMGISLVSNFTFFSITNYHFHPSVHLDLWNNCKVPSEPFVADKSKIWP